MPRGKGDSATTPGSGKINTGITRTKRHCPVPDGTLRGNGPRVSPSRCAPGIEPHVIPATSSVTLAFARLGLDWDDALVISAHGREPRGPKHALAAALAHPKAAILTAPRTATARDLGAELLAAGKRVYVAECLGTSQEQVIDLAAEPAREFAEPNILIALDQAAPSTPRWLAGHQGAPDGWALPEDAFEHRDSMITKAEVRALILARLGPASAASSGT